MTDPSDSPSPLGGTLPLIHGGPIPRLGLGLFRSKGSKAENAVLWALEAGYRHLDTATMYGNEDEVGEAIRMSGTSREEIFVTSKLWNDDHGYDQARKALELSLERLGLDHLDLYLIHFPVPELRKESWRALEDAYDEGLVRAIGVSNYMTQHLAELLSHARVPPAVNQIELHPFNFRTRSEVVELCEKEQIVVEAYSPLTKARRLNDPVVVRAAREYGKSPAQILIRYGIEKGWVTLPKSSNRERIRENAQVFDFALTAKTLEALDQLDEGLAVSWDPTDAP